MVTLLLLALSSGQFSYAQEAPSKDLDEYINKALKDWDVPGLAIAIVKNDQMVFAKGYGVRKFGDPTPVDEKTLFAIGSSSKAFTSASIAMLIDGNKLKWDDPATKYQKGRRARMARQTIRRESQAAGAILSRRGIDGDRAHARRRPEYGRC